MSLVSITTSGCELAELRPYPSVSSTDTSVGVSPILGPDGKTTFNLSVEHPEATIATGQFNNMSPRTSWWTG